MKKICMKRWIGLWLKRALQNATFQRIAIVSGMFRGWMKFCRPRACVAFYAHRLTLRHLLIAAETTVPKSQCRNLVFGFLTHFFHAHSLRALITHRFFLSQDANWNQFMVFSRLRPQCRPHRLTIATVSGAIIINLKSIRLELRATKGSFLEFQSRMYTACQSGGWLCGVSGSFLTTIFRSRNEFHRSETGFPNPQSLAMTGVQSPVWRALARAWSYSGLVKEKRHWLKIKNQKSMNGWDSRWMKNTLCILAELCKYIE